MDGLRAMGQAENVLIQFRASCVFFVELPGWTHVVVVPPVLVS